MITARHKQADLKLVGQLPYESRISKRREYLPVVSSLVGAPGQ